MIKISSIIPNPHNPRFIKDDKFKKLCENIKALPEGLALRPIVVDENNVVLGGNMRLKALIELGYKEVPDDWVKPASGFTPEQIKRFIITDNVGYGEWDWDMIASDWDVDELKDWGMDIPEFAVKEVEAEEDDYEVPETIETDIVLGDLFEIGEHRLLCGDSTNLDDVLKLLSGVKPDILFTDPPYNVSFNGRSGNFDVIQNDNLSDGDFDKFIEEFAQTVHSLEIKNKYIWCNWKFYGTLLKHFDVSACIVWAKNVFGLGSGYRHQHEFCFFSGKLDNGIKSESDLWEIAKDTNYLHPTQKPIALANRALNNHKSDKNILDLFGGSGSTLIAVHQLRRRGYIMELDPKYCQVIVDRMLKLDPNIEIKRNGQIYKPAKDRDSAS